MVSLDKIIRYSLFLDAYSMADDRSTVFDDSVSTISKRSGDKGKSKDIWNNFWSVAYVIKTASL